MPLDYIIHAMLKTGKSRIPRLTKLTLQNLLSSFTTKEGLVAILGGRSLERGGGPDGTGEAGGRCR